MPENNTIHACSKCGAQYAKWQGRCNECGSWGTVILEAGEAKNRGAKIIPDQPTGFNEISAGEQARMETGIGEIDRVLGGGIVRGSLILLGGDPGIGKSTLALQLAEKVSDTLYISGEESAQQVKSRAERIGLNLNGLKFVPQTSAEKIAATIREIKPRMAIVDSIQTISNGDSSAGLGSATQITACTTELLGVAKQTNIPIIIIGHVTKEGYVAGPKALEHLVDTVLYLENDNRNHYKILRSVKNRFGSTGEIGIFEMTGAGLKEVPNPADVFIDKHHLPSPGSVTSMIMEGLRPFLVEIQALATKTNFGYPIRKANGFDLNRLQMLIAVISKIAKIDLGNQDIYLNITGGLKIKETATDLAVCLAIISAFLEKTISKKTLIFGEVGLSGEIRSISQIQKRLGEAKKMGFVKIIAPPHRDIADTANIIFVNNIQEAIRSIN